MTDQIETPAEEPQDTTETPPEDAEAPPVKTDDVTPDEADKPAAPKVEDDEGQP